MHISEGILSGEVCIASAAAAALIAAWSLKKTDQEKIPETAVMTAAIFVTSLIHVKVGPASAHLLLNGLAGILLGISAFPAILIALLFQAVMFQHGGVTTLGVNLLAIGTPALIASAIFRLPIGSSRFSKKIYMIKGFAAGAGAVLLSGLFMAGFLYLAGDEFSKVSGLIIGIHLPVALLEGIITALIISFLQKVKPELVR